MKREDIIKHFPNATKKQIDALLTINGEDINKAKGDLDAVQGQLTMARQQITVLEKAGKDAKTHKDRADQLQAELDGMKQAEGIRSIRQKVAWEKKIPENLLTGETEEACNAQAVAILAFAKPGAYPKIQDGGEPAGKDDGRTSGWQQLSAAFSSEE